MSARRWLLLGLAILGLLLLVVGGVVLAFSVPVTATMEKSARLPGDEEPAAGLRAVAVPVRDVTAISTVATTGKDPITQRAGALVLAADDAPQFPATATNASVVRALAYVPASANGSYASNSITFHNLTRLAGNVTETYDATVEVAPLALGHAGFIVKADTEETIRFVPSEHVLGEVQGYVDGTTAYFFLLFGALGFVIPILGLIFTHRPSGKRGLPGGVAVASGTCPECRAPLTAGADFCTRCGAFVTKELRP